MAIPLNKLTGMPRMRAAFSGWTSNISLTRIRQSIVDGLNVDVSTTIQFRGVIQPFSPQQLILKPEGERSWEWLLIHCLTPSPLDLEPSDRIIYNCKRYKIMASNDYSLNGFIEYHAVFDYQGINS